MRDMAANRFTRKMDSQSVKRDFTMGVRGGPPPALLTRMSMRL